MKRSFYRRGQQVEVEGIEGVAAVKVARTERGARAARRENLGAAIPHANAAERGLAMTPEEAAAFERADWVFVEPAPAVRTATARGAVPDGVQAVGSVVRDTDGRLSVVSNDLVVKLDPNLSEEQSRKLLSEHNVDIVRKLRFAPNLFEARSTDNMDGIDKSVELHGVEHVISAEPNLIQHIPGRAPSDPLYSRQWQWDNSGQDGGVPGADVKAENAWAATWGAGVRVAVIDNGFQYDHEDLGANVDPLSGYFDSTGSFRQQTSGMPDSGHGTFCAAQVAACVDNGKGGCGVAPEAKLVLISVLADQVGTQATLARGVAYAADPSMESVNGEGVDVLACSLGPNGADWALTTVLEDALNFAAASGRKGRGLPIFWATTNGNFPISHDEVVSHAVVIRVGRSTRSDTENNSGYGPELDFLAPGVDVYNAVSGGTYRFWTGTSFAAPLAAGIGALVLSIAPDLTGEELRTLMHDSCDKVGGVPYPGGRNDDYGHGRVNAERAVAAAKQAVNLHATSSRSAVSAAQG
jgi:subtilisin family serine protease